MFRNGSRETQRCRGQVSDIEDNKDIVLALGDLLMERSTLLTEFDGVP